MQKSKSLSELIGSSSKVLSELRKRLDERSQLLLQVRATLPAPLVGFVISAGLVDGQLTLGTGSATWASRLRYVMPKVLPVLLAEHGLKIDKVKIRVVRV